MQLVRLFITASIEAATRPLTTRRSTLPSLVGLLCWLGSFSGAALADGIFSKLAPGQVLPAEFRLVAYPNIKPNQFALVLDEGKTVLKVTSNNSAGSMAVPTAVLGTPTSSTLQWRWKIDRLLDRADMDEKMGDDHSARLYVFF